MIDVDIRDSFRGTVNQRVENRTDGLVIAEWKEEPFQDLAYAGIELFVIKDNYEQRFNTIKRLVEEGSFTPEALNERVAKILHAKSWIGLDTIQPQLDREMAGMIMENGFDDYERAMREKLERELSVAVMGAAPIKKGSQG